MKGKIMWTEFWDMHSGGGLKEPPYSQIYIEAPQEEAEIIFYNKFGHNPNRVSCTCCGEDYAVEEGESLEEITKYQREDSFSRLKKAKLSVKEYEKESDVLIIRSDEISDDHRTGSLREEGYVWV